MMQNFTREVVFNKMSHVLHWGTLKCFFAAPFLFSIYSVTTETRLQIEVFFSWENRVRKWNDLEFSELENNRAVRKWMTTPIRFFCRRQKISILPWRGKVYYSFSRTHKPLLLRHVLTIFCSIRFSHVETNYALGTIRNEMVLLLCS